MRVLIYLLSNICVSLALGRHWTKTNCSKIPCPPGKPVCVHIKQNSRNDNAYWFKLLSYVYMPKCELERLTCEFGDLGRIVPMKMCKARNPIRTIKARKSGRLRSKRRAPIQEVKDGNEIKDIDDENQECPKECPTREVLVCARCKHGVYRTFMSSCYMRMFQCEHPTDKLELVSRQACMQSGPYRGELPRPAEALGEPNDKDPVLDYIFGRKASSVKVPGGDGDDGNGGAGGDTTAGRESDDDVNGGSGYSNDHNGGVDGYSEGSGDKGDIDNDGSSVDDRVRNAVDGEISDTGDSDDDEGVNDSTGNAVDSELDRLQSLNTSKTVSVFGSGSANGDFVGDDDGGNDSYNHGSGSSEVALREKIERIPGDIIVSDNTCKGDIAQNVEIDVPESCPISTKNHNNNFTSYMKADLHPDAPVQGPALWEIKDYGVTIQQKNNKDASAMVGCPVFAGLDFSGYVMVDGVVDDDHIGLVFGYQSNKKFYLITWKGSAEFNSMPDGELKDKAYSKAGVHVKLVNSTTGPSAELRQALWLTESTTAQVTLLWLDPKNQGWKPKTVYKWSLVHRPHIGVIRIKIFTNSNNQLFLDSGNIYDGSIKGGRAGLYCFSQQDIIWSDLQYNCNDTIPEDVLLELPVELKKNSTL